MESKGPTDDPAIEKLRNRQVKNFLTMNVLALGVPMILMGDEMRHSQRGNNNAYCQDNEISWLDWTLLDKHADVHRFVQLLIQRRLLRDEDAERQRKTLNQLVHEAIKSWHGVKLNQPDWSDGSHSLALSVEVEKEKLLFYLILNAHWDPLDFELPATDVASQGPMASMDRYKSRDARGYCRLAPCIAGCHWFVSRRRTFHSCADCRRNSRRIPRPPLTKRKCSVPHPFDSFLSKGWETTEPPNRKVDTAPRPQMK